MHDFNCQAILDHSEHEPLTGHSKSGAPTVAVPPTTAIYDGSVLQHMGGWLAQKRAW